MCCTTDNCTWFRDVIVFTLTLAFFTSLRLASLHYDFLWFPCSASERRELVERYGIPAHVRIILSMLSAHNESDFPYSTDRWSFATTVHPAVRLALFYAE